MSDELLPYYERELSYLRKLGAEFASAHPKIASRLSMDRETVEDPHVSRLIEAFAFLNARLRHKLDDDFPEIAESLLAALYPHYQAPIPSMMIGQFSLDPLQGDMTGGYQLDRGTIVETEPLAGKGVDGERCRYRTCYEQRVWPIRVADARFLAAPFKKPYWPAMDSAQAVLHLSLETFAKGVGFKQMTFDRLRFYLHGQFQHASALYELLLNSAMGVACASTPEDKQPLTLGPDVLRPVGFLPQEGLLDYPERSFLGYRLLSEYFAFPEKFLFVDVTGLTAERRKSFGDRLEVFVFFPETVRDLEVNIRRDSVALDCVPLINLFSHRAEPIRLTQSQSEYRVTADARRPLALEIYSIDRAVATASNHQEAEFRPFFSFKHQAQTAAARRYWHASRRGAIHGEEDVDQGTEIDLSLVDLDFQLAASADWVLDLSVTCLNRDLPQKLPFGGGQPRLQLTRAAPLQALRCLTRPTATVRPQLGFGARWRVLSHLMLNYLSLTRSENGAEALREILSLYDFRQSSEKRAIIDSILSVKSAPAVARVPGAPGAGVCRGVEVEITLNEDKFSGGGLFLFASVLEHFLGLYCNINSFTRLVARTNKREQPLRVWAPRAGEQVLL